MGHDPMTSMIPHGFMSPFSMMSDPLQSVQQFSRFSSNNPNTVSFCSSSVTSYTTDEHGRTQVYQQSNECKTGPNGIKETKSAVRDSRTGHRELAIGHHIRDKAHIKKKSMNAYTGDEEQCEDFVNLEAEEAESFEQNWARQARNLSANPYQLQNGGGRSASSRANRLALTSSAHEDHPAVQALHRTNNPQSSSSGVDKSLLKTKKKKKSKEARV